MIEKFKNWSKNKLWPWFKSNWMIIINFVVLGILYGALPTESGLGALVGIWIFVQIGVIFWRLFNK